MHPPVARGRAANLERHPLRQRAGERRRRSRDAPSPTSTTITSRRTREPPTRSTSSTTANVAAAAAIRPTVLFLTCDAFGVLPPLARLTPEQALYHFLSGYTAKVAGTEAGRDGAGGDVQHLLRGPVPAAAPGTLRRHAQGTPAQARAPVWLVNTGWSGGPPGEGNRIRLSYTRAMVRAILNGSLTHGSFLADPVFGLMVPQSCPGVPAEVLRPRRELEEPWRVRQQGASPRGPVPGQFQALRGAGVRKRAAGGAPDLRASGTW